MLATALRMAPEVTMEIARLAEDADRETMLEGARRVVAEDADHEAMLAAARRVAPVVAAWGDEPRKLSWWQRL